MAQNENVEFFLRALNERFADFKQRYEQLVSAVAQENKAAKKDAATKLLLTIDDLKRHVSKKDLPPWVGPLEVKVRWYSEVVDGHANAGPELLNTIRAVDPEIKRQKWGFDEAPAADAVNFGQIYTEYYSASRVPALFDQLVQELESIIRTGAIDSIKGITSLEKLIATIRANGGAGYFETLGVWEYTRTFFKHLAWGALEKIPVVGVAFKAVRETLKEIDVELDKVNTQVKQKMDEAIEDAIPVLDHEFFPGPILGFRPLIEGTSSEPGGGVAGGALPSPAMQ